MTDHVPCRVGAAPPTGILASLAVVMVLAMSPGRAGAAPGDITLLNWYRINGGCGVSDVFGWTDWGKGTPKHHVAVGQFPNTLYIFNVEDPANPQLRSLITPFPVYDMKVRAVHSPVQPYSAYVYGATGAYCQPEPSVIYDVTNPGVPQFAGTMPGGHNMGISGGLLYLSRGTCGLEAYDLNADPANPPKVFDEKTAFPPSSQHHSHDTTPRGDLVYDFSATRGVDIYDVTDIGAVTWANVPHGDVDPLDPSSGIGRGAHSGDVTDDGRYLFICDEYNSALSNTPYGGPEDIFVYDILNPETPSLVGTITDTESGVHNLIIRGNFALTSFFSAGFRVYDVSNPANGTPLLDEYDTNDGAVEGSAYGAWGVYADDRGYVYVSDQQNGLFIFAVEGLSPTTGTSGQLLMTSGISGRVRNYDGTGYPFATLTFEDQCGTRVVTTDAEGYYEHFVPTGWSGAVVDVGPYNFSFDATGEYTADYTGGVNGLLTGQNWTRDQPVPPPCRGCPDPQMSNRQAGTGLSNVPNPFNPATTIQYRLAQPGMAALKIYDVSGRLVRSAALPFQPSGGGTWHWDGTDDAGQAVAAGVYIAHLNVGGRTLSQHRMTLIR